MEKIATKQANKNPLLAVGLPWRPDVFRTPDLLIVRPPSIRNVCCAHHAKLWLSGCKLPFPGQSGSLTLMPVIASGFTRSPVCEKE
jgi:hypothetical protein